MDETTSGFYERIRRLEVEVERLRRRSDRLRAWTVGCGLLATAALVTPNQNELEVFGASSTHQTVDSLRVRCLAVVDQNGVERVLIAAPLPDPLLLGKRTSREGTVSGILLHDAEGNERGGYVTGDDDRSAALTLDELGRAAIHLGVGDRGDIHFTLSNGAGGFVGLAVLPDETFLRLDEGSKTVATLPKRDDGSGK